MWTLASFLFPLATFHISLLSQNLCCTIAIGIPCFLLAECVALSGFKKVESVALGVIGPRQVSHFLISNGKWIKVPVLA